ncbi:MAG: YfcC family protein [Clostridia bacterium]|nr:YfcC family protein [Clostridia bacterium]
MTDNKELQHTQTSQKPSSNIEFRSLIIVVIILSSLLIISGILSYIIPQGSFSLDDSGVIITDSYVKGEIKGIAVWRIVTAPARVFVSDDAVTIIMISVFLLIMSGVFNLIEKSHGTKVVISRLMHRFADKGAPVVCLCVLVFMLFGSFFGMFEELVTLLPLIILFMLSLGMDSMTGLGACLLAACFGFSAAITNPFSVGLAAQVAGIGIQDGMWLRIIFFIITYVTLCTFLMIHLKKISNDPKSSPSYEIDLIKKEASLNEFGDADMRNPENDRIFKVFSIFFMAQALILVLIASIRSISGLAIPILAASFLLGGIICGLIVCEKKGDTFLHIARGAASMIPAVLMIALASSIKLVMTESGIIDTIMHYVIELLDGKSRFASILLVYLLILILQVFIGSSSAKIMLVLPIVVPICASIGISPSMVILAYCMADGFTDVILPTNPVLLVGLSMANVSYSKWFKWTWKLQLFVLALTVLVLLFATGIRY